MKYIKEASKFGLGHDIISKEEEILNNIKEYFCDLTDDGFQIHEYKHPINFVYLNMVLGKGIGFQLSELVNKKPIGFDLNLNKKIDMEDHHKIIDIIEDIEVAYNRLTEDGFKFNHFSLKFLYRWGGISNITLFDEKMQSSSPHFIRKINFNKIINNLYIEEGIPFEIILKTTIIQEI
jgi:hypothetical protein